MTKKNLADALAAEQSSTEYADLRTRFALALASSVMNAAGSSAMPPMTVAAAVAIFNYAEALAREDYARRRLDREGGRE